MGFLFSRAHCIHFVVLMTRQTFWHYFQRNWSMFKFLAHAKPPRSMVATLEMPQYVAFLKNIAYCFIKLSAKSHSLNILCIMDMLSCPTTTRQIRYGQYSTTPPLTTNGPLGRSPTKLFSTCMWPLTCGGYTYMYTIMIININQNESMFHKPFTSWYVIWSVIYCNVQMNGKIHGLGKTSLKY